MERNGAKAVASDQRSDEVYVCVYPDETGLVIASVPGVATPAETLERALGALWWALTIEGGEADGSETGSGEDATASPGLPLASPARRSRRHRSARPS